MAERGSPRGGTLGTFHIRPLVPPARLELALLDPLVARERARSPRDRLRPLPAYRPFCEAKRLHPVP